MAKDKPLQQQYLGPGSSRIELAPSDFIKGMSTSNFSEDAGYSNSSSGIDIFSLPGVIRGSVPLNQISSTSGTWVACSETVAINSAAYRIVLNSNGTLYGIGYDGAVSSLYSDTSGNTYARPYSDIILYGGNYYYASQNDVAQIVYSSGTVMPAWFSNTTGGSVLNSFPHPMVVFNRRLYIADQENIRMYDPTQSTPSVIVYSGDIGTVILAMTIDPSSGRMLVSFENQTNSGGVMDSSAWIGYYDGINPTQLLKKIEVEQRVTAFYNVGGTIYVIYGENLGMWNGNGIIFLRKLNTKISSTTSIDRSRLSNIGNILLIADGNNVLAYGENVMGNKVFTNLFTAANDMTIDILTSIGTSTSSGGTGGIGYDINILGNSHVSNTTIFQATPNGTGSFVSNIINIPAKKAIMGIDVFMDQAITTGSITMTLTDDNGTTINCGPNSSNVLTSGLKARLLFQHNTTSFQINATFSTCNAGIRRVIVYYNDYE